MLLGEFQYTIDEKGRIFIPSKLREELGAEVVVSKGFDDCLFIYSNTEFQKFVSEIEEMDTVEQRNVIRFFCGGSSNTPIDKQGRINLPLSLREYAGLEKDVMIVGALNKVELWDKQRWEALNSKELTSAAIIDIMRASKRKSHEKGEAG